MKKYRIFALLVIAIVTGTLTGCNNVQNPPGETQTQVETNKAPRPSFEELQKLNNKTFCISRLGITYIDSNGKVINGDNINYSGKIRQLVDYNHVIGEDGNSYYTGYSIYWDDEKIDERQLVHNSDGIYFIEKKFKTLDENYSIKLISNSPMLYDAANIVITDEDKIYICDADNGPVAQYARINDHDRIVAVSNDLILTEKGNIYRCYIGNGSIFNDRDPVGEWGSHYGNGKVMLELVNDTDNAIAVAGSSDKYFVVSADNTVRYYSKNNYNPYREGNVKEWQDIIQVLPCTRFTLGVKKDGGVIVAGECIKDIENAVKDWTDIAELQYLALSDKIIVAGRKKDGSFVQVEGKKDYRV